MLRFVIVGTKRVVFVELSCVTPASISGCVVFASHDGSQNLSVVVLGVKFPWNILWVCVVVSVQIVFQLSMKTILLATLFHVVFTCVFCGVSWIDSMCNKVLKSICCCTYLYAILKAKIFLF